MTTPAQSAGFSFCEFLPQETQPQEPTTNLLLGSSAETPLWLLPTKAAECSQLKSQYGDMGAEDNQK